MFDDTDRRLLNDWQRDFPLVDRPFAELASTLGVDEAEVLRRLARLQQQGAPAAAWRRIWAAGAGGGVDAVRLRRAATAAGRRGGSRCRRRA